MNPPAKTTSLLAAFKHLKPPSQRKVSIAPVLLPGAAPAKSMKEEAAAASSVAAPSPVEVAEHPTPTRPQKQVRAPRRKSAGARGRPTASANRRAAAVKPVPEKYSVGEMRQPSARQLRKIKRRLFLEAVHSDNVPGKTRRSSARHEVSGKKALRQGKE
ncbi:hypothetical protein ACHAXT_009939 [Thalassiosira profunda]